MKISFVSKTQKGAQMRSEKIFLVPLLFSCMSSSEKNTELTDSAAEQEATDTEDTDNEDADTGNSNEEFELQSLTGSIVWELDFNEEAEALGFTDCSYQRDYSGNEEWSAPWLCDTCEKSFLVDVDLSIGLDDCYAQIATDPAEKERLGWSADGVFHRGTYPNYKQTEQGTVSFDGDSFTTHNEKEIEMSEGGGFTFNINGSFELGEGGGDPLLGMEPPESYACGWPKADPPPFTGSYTLNVGEKLPDGVFKDHCDEPVRLHDFMGKYLFIDISATNCGPCKILAQTEAEFIESMNNNGIEVEVITLMAPSLSAILDPTPVEVLQDWVDTYSLHSPVFADRGWGYWLGKEALGEDFGYPTWLIVSPELEVLEISKGFGVNEETSTWDGISEIISNHAAE